MELIKQVLIFMTSNNKNSRVKSAFELYGEKKKKEGEEKNSKAVYERALKMGYDEKTAHILAYGD